MSRSRFWMIVAGVGSVFGLVVGVTSGLGHGAAAGFVAAFGVIVFHGRLFSRCSELRHPAPDR